MAIAAIMLVAAFMRFYHYADWSLSNDELSALSRLRFDGFFEMINLGARIDGHPAGVQVFLWFWTGLFGNSAWVVRLPFVIFGILSVWFVFLIGKKWFGSSTALFAATTMAFLQYPVLYSQLARPYSPGLLFSMMAIYYWSIIVFDSQRKLWHYFAFALSATLALYSHHFSFLLMLITGFSGFIFYKHLNYRKYILAAFLVFLLYLPHLEIFFHQLSLGGVGGPEGWLGKPGPDWIINYVFYTFNESWALPALLGATFITSFFLFRRKFTAFHVLSLSWFLLLFLIGYFYSIWRNPILQPSVLIFAFPLLLLFFFSFLKPEPGRIGYILLFFFLAGGILQTTVVNGFYKKQHFGEFEKVAEKIVEWNRILGSENVSNSIVVNDPYYIHFYLDKINPDIRFLQYNNEGGKDLLALNQILDSVKTDYFVHAWTKPEPAEIDLMIREKYPCLLEKMNFDGLSEVALYSKLANDSCKKFTEPVEVFYNGFEGDDLWHGTAAHLDSSFRYSGAASYKIDSMSVYEPYIKKLVHEINGGDFDKVEIEVSVFTNENLRDMPLVFTADNAENGGYIWKGSKIENFIVPGKWGKVFLKIDGLKFQSKQDIIQVYIWNPQQQTIYLDDFKVRFFKD